MVRDLAEFGKPFAVIDTSKLSFVNLFDYSGVSTAPPETRYMVQVVCDGALVDIVFSSNERDLWERCYNAMRRDLIERG